MKWEPTYTILLLLIFLLVSCGGSAPVETLPSDAPPSPIIEASPVVEETPTTALEPTAVPEPDFDPQPPDGQRVEFEASDGTALVGYYYPASVSNAPIIILMHWAGGDQTDWQKNGMIDWLQNRGGSSKLQSLSQQSVIYPLMPEGVSFAVFTFDFRGFGESGGEFRSGVGLLDAEAAYAIAKTLIGIDPTRMVGIGSSIGADGVVDACLEGCLGALSLSPGSYLKVPYSNAVKTLDDAGKPVTCVASEGDSTSASACNDAAGENYQRVIYPGSAHGDQLLQEPNIPDDIGQLILDWLVLAFSINA